MPRKVQTTRVETTPGNFLIRLASCGDSIGVVKRLGGTALKPKKFEAWKRGVKVGSFQTFARAENKLVQIDDGM